MKKYILIVFFIAMAMYSYSQSISSYVVASGGGYSEAGGLSLSYTIGELATETFSTTMILTQGFQQGYYEVTAIDDPLSKSIGLKVFPNPAVDYVNILIEDKDVEKVRIELYNMEGKLIFNDKWENNGTAYQLQLNGFKSSQYILRILDDKSGGVQSYKIIKR